MVWLRAHYQIGLYEDMKIIPDPRPVRPGHTIVESRFTDALGSSFSLPTDPPDRIEAESSDVKRNEVLSLAHMSDNIVVLR
jgi:hypothetical protein